MVIRKGVIEMKKLLLVLGIGCLALIVLAGCIYVGNMRPIASFTATPNNGTSPLTVTFDASESYDPDGTIEAYLWDFGDGQTASLVVPTTVHQYTVQTDSRVFTAILTVTDNLGATDTTVRNISVEP